MSTFNYQAWALFIVRLLLGATFMLHGSQKVFGLFGGKGLESFASSVVAMGTPKILGYAAALFEFFGGLLIFLGIATELGALLTIPVMIGAIVLVHGSHGYFAQSGGFEYALNLLILAVVLIIGGPGTAALWDPFITWR